MKKTALYIEFVDAQTWSNAWLDAEDIAEMKLPIYRVRGEVIKETPTDLYLAQATSGTEHRNIFGIPKGCILKQRKIP